MSLRSLNIPEHLTEDDFKRILIFCMTVQNISFSHSTIHDQRNLIRTLLAEDDITVETIETMYNVNLHNKYSPTYIRLMEDNILPEFLYRKSHIESTFTRLYKILPKYQWLNLDLNKGFTALLKYLYNGNIQLGLAAENKIHIDEFYNDLTLKHGNPIPIEILEHYKLPIEKLKADEIIVFIYPPQIEEVALVYSLQSDYKSLITLPSEKEISHIRFNHNLTTSTKTALLIQAINEVNSDKKIVFEYENELHQFLFYKFKYNHLLSKSIGKHVMYKTPLIKCNVIA